MNHLLVRVLVHSGLCVLILVLLSACGGISLPKTSALPALEQREAIERLTTLAQEPLPPSVETDYLISWNILGSSGRVDAVLLMDEPDQLRFSAHDPLGRTLYLAVSDGTNFTMVNNRAATVRRGRVDGASWRSVVPEPLILADIVPLLGGRVHGLTSTLSGQIEAAQNPEQTGYWFVWQDSRKFSHHLLLDRERNLVARHLLVDKKDTILLDVSYLNYDLDEETGYYWPKTTEVSGSIVKGKLLLERQGLLSFDPLPVATFFLELPSHFKVEQLR